MFLHSFFNDYSEGAHNVVLDVLTKTNLEQQPGYCEDQYTIQAKQLILSHLDNKQTHIHFVSGGTQANLINIASMLQSYESVIAAESAHIAVHEAGAIEATGHKINTVPSKDGKLTVEGIDGVNKSHTDEHMVKPKVVFVSNSTELGTVYNKQELTAISDYCQANNLYLYLDGARLGSALESSESDLTLNDINELTDIFYIGGTKNGALLGEAIIISNPELQENFRFHLKQRGALLAKGRAIGIQFLALFTDDLFFKLAKHANTQAQKISNAAKELGYELLVDSTSNQIFPIFPKTLIQELSKKFGFYEWQDLGDKSATRLVTSWATTDDAINLFIEELKNLTS